MDNLRDALGEIGEWADRALCKEVDTDLFYPEKGGSTREAKSICAGCEVRVECLDYALTNDERFGVYGGFSERERRRMKLTVVEPVADLGGVA